jgi:glycosyltransferase involved in cell wall biosynthesis
MGRGVRHVVFVTQVVDPLDPALGFVTGWIRALAERVDRVTAVGNEVRGPVDLGPGVEVVSLGKEDGAGRLRRGARLSREVDRAARGSGTVLLAHMCPVYLNLAAPIARLRRVPTMLWFAHPAVTPSLRLAEGLTDAVLTSLPGAYPRPGPKVHVVGQATDTDRLIYDEGWSPPGDGVLRLLALGRTSPSKGFDRIIRAVARVRDEGLDARLRIVGPSTTEGERDHARSLVELVADRGLTDVVRLDPGVPPSEVPSIVLGADVLVNAMVAGSGDKVVFEAAALGRLPLVSNPSFRGLLQDLPLPLMFERDDEAMLASRITMLASAEGDAMNATRRELRCRVVSAHSLRGWAERVLDVAGELR